MTAPQPLIIDLATPIRFNYINVTEAKFKQVRQSKEKYIRELPVHVVVAVDYSGSMNAGDGFDRMGHAGTRLDSAKSDCISYFSQLVNSKKLLQFDLCIFGARLYYYADIKDLSQLINCLNAHNYEPHTYTLLLVNYLNSLFAPREGVCYWNIIMTDGTPTPTVGNDVDDARRQVAMALVRGNACITEDSQRATTFLQYGKDSGAEEFLRYLDDDLSKLAKTLGVNCWHDTVDTGKSSVTWRKKGGKKPRASWFWQRWNKSVFDMLVVALCD